MSSPDALRSKLEMAAQALRKLGAAECPFLSRFDTAAKLAEHLEAILAAWKEPALPEKFRAELLLVFAPTGAFDEYFDDLDFSNEVYALLKG